MPGSAAMPSLSFLADSNTGFYNYTANAIGVALAGTEQARFANGGYFFCNILSAFSGQSLACTGSVTTGATAIGVKVGNVNNLTTSGAKITSFYSDNLSTERAYISNTGIIGTSTLIANSTGTVSIVNDSTDLLESNAGWLEIQTLNGTRYRLPIWPI
jgi:hypothetical protein